MAAQQEHGGRWDGFGPEPLTDAEWEIDSVFDFCVARATGPCDSIFVSG